jgi:transposase-like protein
MGYVHLIVSELNNGESLSQQGGMAVFVPGSNSEAAQGFTAERVLRTRPKTYRAVVQLLADPHARVNQIAKLHRVSTHTVRAIRYREAQGIADRKKTLAAMLANVAELGAERMEETIGKANLRDANIKRKRRGQNPGNQ